MTVSNCIFTSQRNKENCNITFPRVRVPYGDHATIVYGTFRSITDHNVPKDNDDPYPVSPVGSCVYVIRLLPERTGPPEVKVTGTRTLLSGGFPIFAFFYNVRPLQLIYIRHRRESYNDNFIDACRSSFP